MTNYYKQDLKNHNLISFLYRDFTPVINGCFDIKHKNWSISEGASYASTAIINFDLNTVKKALETKNIKLFKNKLRQDKKLNKYFWIGFKLAVMAT